MKIKILNLFGNNELFQTALTSIALYSRGVVASILLYAVLLLLQKIKDDNTVNSILNSKKKCKNLKSIDLKNKTAEFFENRPTNKKGKKDQRLKEVA